MLIKYICTKEFYLEQFDNLDVEIDDDSLFSTIEIDEGSLWNLDNKSKKEIIPNGIRLFRVLGKKIIWIEIEKSKFKKHFKMYK